MIPHLKGTSCWCSKCKNESIYCCCQFMRNSYFLASELAFLVMRSSLLSDYTSKVNN